MRNALLTGAAVLLIAMGAVGVSNAANQNVPTYSPYTLMAVPGSVPDIVTTTKPVATADQMNEGRAAFIEDQPQRTYFPLTLLPWNW